MDAVAETPNDALTCDNNGDLTSGGNNKRDAQSGVLLSDANKTDEEDKVTASPASHVEQEEGKVKHLALYDEEQITPLIVFMF